MVFREGVMYEGSLQTAIPRDNISKSKEVAGPKDLPPDGVHVLPLMSDKRCADLRLPRQPELNRNLAIRGNKILVIDDDRVLCIGFDIRLIANNYNPCFAHDAESALSIALSEMPSLIILDIGLPGHDGYFVMQRFKEFPTLAHVPIIVLTARDAFTHQKRCRDAGAKRFFEKPVSIPHLMTAIRQLVG
jgi:CheY-like chemotaxis protein